MSHATQLCSICARFKPGIEFRVDRLQVRRLFQNHCRGLSVLPAISLQSLGFSSASTGTWRAKLVKAACCMVVADENRSSSRNSIAGRFTHHRDAMAKCEHDMHCIPGGPGRRGMVPPSVVQRLQEDDVNRVGLCMRPKRFVSDMMASLYMGILEPMFWPA